jgi:peptidoglycan/LPS O-acetylase OafA/YrhL
MGLTPWIHVFWNRYDVAMMAYIGNFFMPGGVLGHHADLTMVVYQTRHVTHNREIAIGSFWSLCVEEQFYLVWPAIVWWVRSRRKLIWICIAVIIAEPIFRIFYLHWRPYMLHAQGLYLTTFCRVDTLLVGAFVALWLRGANPAPLLIRKCSYFLVFGAFSILALALRIEWHIVGPGKYPDLSKDPVITTIGFTLIALAGAGILLLTIDNGSLVARILKNKALLWLGRISYGMYLLHAAVASIIVGRALSPGREHIAFLFPILGALISIGLAWLSFRFIESPFLKLKRSLAPRPGAADDPPPYRQPQRTEEPSPAS